jgi:peptide/nickel transport system ATP-binding protein
MALLEVSNLQTHFGTPDGVVRAVEGLSFHIDAGETVGIVGESGCGKSVTSMSILRLIAEPPGKIAGSIRFEGRDLLQASEQDMCELRGNAISMIFQEPMTSLNPVLTVGKQIGETVRLHQGMNARDAEAKAIEMLTLVGMPAPARRVRDYPHQLSGGMRQRVMIAMALACNPRLLIADEPTTALDVTIQAQILDLLQDMKSRLGMSIMLITHAMGVVAEVAQRVAVMYAGKVVEEASVDRLFANPRHPYTQGLIRSIPRIDLAAARKQRLETIAGTVPKLIDPPVGCRFAARCRFAVDECRRAQPELREIEAGHRVACIRAEETVIA